MLPTKINPFFDEKKKAKCLPAKPNCLTDFFNFRLCIALLMMFSLFCGTSMRMSLSMAVVCMVNSTAVHSSQNSSHILRTHLEMDEQCPREINFETSKQKGYNGELLWTSAMQSQLFSAFFYGGLLTTWFSGFLADRFGPKLLISIAMADYVLISFITPFLANYSFYAYLLARVVMGAGEGLVYPSIASVSSRWFPPQERSTMAGLYTMGNQLGAVFNLLISSRLCSVNLFGGWPLIFYVFAIAGLFSGLLWIVFVTDNPADNKFIGDTEKLYIQKATESQWSLESTADNAGRKANQHSKQLATGPLPWKKMITSLPVLAMLVANATFTFTAILMQSYLPTFFKEVLQLNLSQNGIYSIIPFFLQLALKIPYGRMSDSLKSRGILSNTAACRLFQSIGNFGYVVCFFLMAYFVDCSQLNLVVMLLVLYGLVAPSAICGFFTSMLSLAPAYSGAVTSLAFSFSELTSALAPSMVAFFNKNGTTAEWSRIWYAMSLINLVGGLSFLFFGSAMDVEQQSSSIQHVYFLNQKPSSIFWSTKCHFFKNKCNQERPESRKYNAKSGDPDQDLTEPCVQREGGDRVFVETKHFHEEVKDVEGGHVLVEVMDVDIKVAKKCKIGVAQQPDYSGRLWEDGNNQSAENVIRIDPASHQLPKDWDLDMQGPKVKGEGGDRVYYEAKQLHNADMKGEYKIHQPNTGENLE